jgi:hypothetical protein
MHDLQLSSTKLETLMLAEVDVPVCSFTAALFGPFVTDNDKDLHRLQDINRTGYRTKMAL